jgi:AcrR family transcriptional regulator
LRLFQERGFEATSVRDIAVAAGVSVGTVINAGGKTGLFLASMEENAFALVGGGVERLRAAPPGKRALAAEFTELFDTALTWVAANRELTRDYLIAYLRTGDADPKELNVIIDGLAERCLQHSADSDRQAAALAASVLYSVFVSLVFALAAGTTDLDTARQGLHAVVEAHVRPFGRAR